MGNDGGSIPDRRDLVRTKAKAEQADKANQTRAKWFFCALSKRPLQEPIVSCQLGRLYNKDALLEYLLDRSAYGDGEAICGHIRTLKDVKTLKLTANPLSTSKNSHASTTDSAEDRPQFVCPLTFKEMNGVQPFVYLLSCGCVFSASGLKSLATSPEKEKEKEKAGSSTPPSERENGEKDGNGQLELCPQCGAKYDKRQDVITINPSEEEEENLFTRMLARRAAEPVKSKKSSKKRKALEDAAEGAPPSKSSKKSPNGTPAPTLNPQAVGSATSRAVADSLKAEEVKRKKGMSEEVRRSLYGDPNEPKKKETFMTMGTFTRYA